MMLSMIIVMVLFFSTAQHEPAIEANVVLQGATLYDGSDHPGKVADIAIKNDRIVAVGRFKVKGNPRVLNCEGLVVSPGFIDLHTHSDYPLQDKKTNANFNFQTQGVTTVVTGNCGAGPVDVADYFAKLEKIGIGTNVIHQVPHNDVRFKVMGNENREPTPKELRMMEVLIDKGMKDGAWGLATGLIYNPGTYAKTDEIVALAKIAAQHKGFYASHIRDESDAVLAAIEEILEIARRAGIRVHISHIKVSGRSAWGKAPDVIAILRRARKNGIEVTADQYPYTASSTSLSATVIPAKYREGSAKALIERLDDAEIGPKMKKAIEQRIADHVGGKSVKIARYAKNVTWQGKDLYAIAETEKKSPLDIVIEIQRNGGAQIVHFGMSDEDVRLFMKEPYVATASDGSAMIPSNTLPHPRSYGTFPRKIGRFAIEDKVITPEQAIRSASGLPADILKLPGRGYLKAGYYADIVVFDPKTFRDTATYDRPHQYSTGVRYLFVNGRLAIDDGKSTNALPGRVLRHNEPAPRDNTKVTPEQKQEFLELLKKLPSRGEFYTDEGIQKASPFLHVLLALDSKDINENHYFALLALSRGLHDAKKEHREYAVKHFAAISHPVIKLSWGIMLFRFSNEVSPEVIRYLRESLDDRERSEQIRSMLGPDFEKVRKQILAKAKK